MWWLSNRTKDAMITKLKYYNCEVSSSLKAYDIAVDDYITYTNYAEDLYQFIYQAKTVKEFNQHMATTLDSYNCAEIRQLLMLVQKAMLTCVKQEIFTLSVVIMIIGLLSNL